MKYIKTFEASNNSSKCKYHINQYVLLDLEQIEINNKAMDLSHGPIDSMAKIIEINEYDDYQYRIEFYNGIDNNFVLIKETEIKRLLTLKEKKEFKIKIESVKYNL